MRINKFFLALLLSVLVASSSFALLKQDHAETFSTLSQVPAKDQAYIVIWWAALINIVGWLTLCCISLGHAIREKFNKNKF